jgi:hypothetical protein
MPQFCQPRSISVTQSSRSTSSKHRRNNSCWRNPCVVFLITFGVLFTLRFRTPTKRASFKKILNKKQLQVSKQLLVKSYKSKKQAGPTASPTSTKPKAMKQVLSYKQIDQGTHEGGASFVKYQALNAKGKTVSFQQWAQTMAASDEASDSLTKIIKDASCKALFFETPPANKETALTQQFEFVLVDAPKLALFADGKPDPMPFSTQFEACRDNSLACAFENLGKDALLVAPKPVFSPESSATYHAHLASFVREAPANQVQSVWSLVASNLLQRWIDKNLEPVWLSTSGTGVAWLHFRMDARPKYYTHQPYKTFEMSGTTS